jgi:hypothetical protein
MNIAASESVDSYTHVEIIILFVYLG